MRPVHAVRSNRMNGSDARITCGLRRRIDPGVSTMNGSSHNTCQLQAFGIANGGCKVIATSTSPPNVFAYRSRAFALTRYTSIRGYFAAIEARMRGSGPDK